MTGAANDAEPQVLVRREGRVGRLTLNRPLAINALNLPMIEILQAALTGWVDDPAVRVVLLDGAGEHGFCAGGDIRVVYDSARAGTDVAPRLWRAEYVLDSTIAAYPKPVVTVLDGITMGGGMGLGCHASHRVATERSLLAMPEVSIGLAPDVGGHLLLARAPGELGTYLALTGTRAGPAEALLCGLVDHVVPVAKIAALTNRLQHLDPDMAIARSALPDEEIGDAPLRDARGWIDECFAGTDAEEILAQLRRHRNADAQACGNRLAEMSPTAVAVSLRGLREARQLDNLPAVLRNDYRCVNRSLHTPDLTEGIRAAIIDKDYAPVWSPPTLADVTPDMVEQHFAPLGSEELDLRTVSATGIDTAGAQAGESGSTNNGKGQHPWV